MPDSDYRRPSPDELLRQVEAEERRLRQGRLKVFLGYASGVGKSYRMLDEGRRRKARGEDVVVGAPPLDPSEEVQALVDQFEAIPQRLDLGQPCLDLAAIRQRRPAVCLVDTLAHSNPPGSANSDRWQDVEVLLAAGVSVITTINIQYIRELQPRVEAIRGRRVGVSVPRAFLLRADDIEVVDAPPEYCFTRTLDGRPLSPPETAALQQQLSELRELALLLAAEVVDHQLEDYLRRLGIEQSYGANERILVCITPRSNAALMVGRGRRQADRFHGELFVAYVEQANLAPADRETLQRNLDCARQANAHVEILHGEDPVGAILAFAERQHITQIFVGHSQRSGWMRSLRSNPVERLILESDGIDVRIFPHASGTVPHAG